MKETKARPYGKPVTCVWEVTMGCNMRCGHCGSSCAEPLKDELTSEEALGLCEQLADLGLKWVTLSGGEPTTRKDLPKLVRRLTELGVSVNIITNGWLLTPVLVQKLKESGIATVAISIDGTCEIHDQVRRQGAFAHAEQAFAALKEAGITAGAVTTLTKVNLPVLRKLKEELIRIGADSWQVQLGLPMGNLKERPDWVLDPEQVQEVIDFCYETATEGRIKIFPADCIGYYSKKDMETRRISFGSDHASPWTGCSAGVYSFGILHNGEILGCTSIRDREFIEGSIRERPLREIWEREDTFRWSRELTREKLSGECRSCAYGSRCLGGCPNTRLTMDGSIYGENQYCAYNLAVNKMKKRYETETDPKKLWKTGDALVRAGYYQEGAIALSRLLELSPESVEAYLIRAYAEYRCGNYEKCLEDNEKVLSSEPENLDALDGSATALFAMGERERAIGRMRQAAEIPGIRQEEMRNNLRQMGVMA